MKVIMMIGLPGSGKSTIAKKMLKKDERSIILSRDDIRNMMHGGNYKYTIEKEALIKVSLLSLIDVCMQYNSVVIIDETNITKKHRNYIKSVCTFAALKHNCEVEFMGVYAKTPVDVCKERRCADIKNDWSTIIDNMVGVWEEPTKDEFDEFVVIE